MNSEIKLLQIINKNSITPVEKNNIKENTAISITFTNNHIIIAGTTISILLNTISMLFFIHVKIPSLLCINMIGDIERKEVNKIPRKNNIIKPN
nr:hypothetical protein [Pantoea sp. SoEX]